MVNALATSTAAVPDWPEAPGALPDLPASAAPEPVPDWPTTAPATAPHVVVRGDCLWDIAALRLSTSGSPVTDAAIAAEVHAWWTANVGVIGSNPDLILPGQVLRAPLV
jgi:nucleoid-associated protein YgaU